MKKKHHKEEINTRLMQDYDVKYLMLFSLCNSFENC